MLGFLCAHLIGCKPKDVDSARDDADTASDTSSTTDTEGTGHDECPYDDGGGFYTGGRFTVEPSYYQTGGHDWEYMPDAPGGVGCITLDPDRIAYTWEWLSGSFVAWNEERFDFVEDLTLDCRLEATEFDCVGDTTSTSFEGVEGTPMTVRLGWSGEWLTKTWAHGTVGMYIDCTDYGCDDAWREMYGPYGGGSFPISLRADFYAELDE